MTDSPRPSPELSRIDLDEVSRVVDALESDLALARVDSTRIDALRAEVDQLRAMLRTDEPPHEDVERRLTGVRELVHRLGDELVSDAFEGSRHLAQIGRLLGM